MLTLTRTLTLTLTLTVTLTLTLTLSLTRRGTATRYENYVNELEKAYMAPDESGDEGAPPDEPSAPEDPPPPGQEAWREIRDRRRPS